MTAITPRYEAMQYDGTNGAIIATEWLNNVKFISDDGQTLVIERPVWPGSMQWAIPLHDYVLRTEGRGFYQSISPELYAQNWVAIPGT